MSEPTNLARKGEAVPGADAAPSEERVRPKLTFDPPDEATLQFLEEGWRRFCVEHIGLEGEVPDIRAIVAAQRTNPPPGRRSHNLVRPFSALADWIKGHPDLEDL